MTEGMARLSDLSAREIGFKSVHPIIEYWHMDLKPFGYCEAPGDRCALAFLEEDFGDIELSMEVFYSKVHLYDQFVGDFPKGKGRRRRQAGWRGEDES